MYNTVKPMLCNMRHDDVPAGLSRLQYIADRPGECLMFLLKYLYMAAWASLMASTRATVVAL